MNTTLLEYCDVCKAATRKCEYYPKGRSRQHGKCLECAKRDAKHPESYRSSDPRYCYACDQIRISEKNDKM